MLSSSLRVLGLLSIMTGNLTCKKSDESKPSVEVAAPKKEAAGAEASYVALFQAAQNTMSTEANPTTDDKVALGRMLYYETRLSKNHDVSCNSCHLLDQYGVDSRATSEGHKKQVGGRNAPTVYFAAGHLAQFWDGRAADVEEQAKGPILNPIEMAMPDEASVLKVLESIPGYVEGFKKAFPDEDAPLSYDNLGKAIGVFERGLVTQSRFDKYLAGSKDALTKDEQDGLAKFVEVGCAGCHSGAYLGGSQYRKLGEVTAFPDLKDKGRFEATKSDADAFFFKVPSLLNIAKTGPYFHDGSVAALEDAIKLMGRHQLGADLSDGDTKSIASFLGALTGELPADYIAMPTLPESGPKTPKPDPS